MITEILSLKYFKINLLIFSFVTTNYLSAQNRQLEIAHPAPNGVYVDLGIDLINQTHSFNNMAGYRVDRRLTSESDWKQLDIVRLPNSKQEFEQKLLTITQTLFSSIDLKNIPIDSLWNRIEKYHRLDSLGFWSGSLLIRLAVGSLFYDLELCPNDNYVYRISAVNSSDEILKSVESNSVSFPGIYDRSVLLFNSKSTTENEINITWSSSNNFKPTLINVFKSEGSNTEFNQITVNLFITSQNDSTYYSFTDTLITPSTYYRYYAVPEDLYGNRGNKTEDAFIVSSNFSSSGYPYIINAISIDSIDAIQISWLIRSNELVNYLEVYRSESFDSGFIKIAEVPSAESTYFDYNIEPMKKYEYYVRAVSLLGEFSIPSVRTFALIKSELEPIPPQNLKVVTVEKGVKLQWENTEDFVDGFWVYRTNGIKDSLQLISSLIKEIKPVTEYYDTSETLSGKYTYSYSVKSITTSHIESNFSDTILIRPDLPTMPPTPFNVSAFINDSTARISWSDMTEIEETVFGYRVYRKNLTLSANPNFESLVDSMLPANQNYFVDNRIEKGKTYQYAITSVDLFGVESNPAYSSDLTYEIPNPLPPQGVRYLNSENGIIIQWDETFQNDIKEYRVYRYQRGSSPKMISSVKINSESKVEDRDLIKDNLYYYYVTSVNTFNVEGSKSNEIAVRP